MKKVNLKVGELIEKKKALEKKEGNQKFTQSQIAKETGLREATLSNYKRGHIVRYDVEVLNTLINYFDITDMNEIFEIIEE